MLDLTPLRIGGRVTKRIVEDAKAALLQSGVFQSVEIDVTHHVPTPGKVKVLVTVVER